MDEGMHHNQLLISQKRISTRKWFLDNIGEWSNEELKRKLNLVEKYISNLLNLKKLLFKVTLFLFIDLVVYDTFHGVFIFPLTTK